MEEWEDKIDIIEEIVFARLLLKGAEQNSINIKAISEDPLSIYVECKEKERDLRIWYTKMSTLYTEEDNPATFLTCNQIRKQLLSAQPSPSYEVVSCGWGLATRPFC